MSLKKSNKQCILASFFLKQAVYACENVEKNWLTPKLFLNSAVYLVGDRLKMHARSLFSGFERNSI